MPLPQIRCHFLKYDAASSILMPLPPIWCRLLYLKEHLVKASVIARVNLITYDVTLFFAHYLWSILRSAKRSKHAPQFGVPRAENNRNCMSDLICSTIPIINFPYKILGKNIGYWSSEFNHTCRYVILRSLPIVGPSVGVLLPSTAIINCHRFHQLVTASTNLSLLLSICFPFHQSAAASTNLLLLQQIL